MTPTLQDLIAQDLTLSEMGEILGISKGAVSKRLKAAGLKPPRKRGQGRARSTGRPVAMTPEEVATLVQRAESEGWSQRHAAESAGVHVRTLNGLLKRYGVPWWRA